MTPTKFWIFFQPPNGENVMNNLGGNRLPNIPPGNQQQQQQQNRQPTSGIPPGSVSPYIGEKLPLPQQPSNMGPQRDDGSSGYGSPDSETLEIPATQ